MLLVPDMILRSSGNGESGAASKRATVPGISIYLSIYIFISALVYHRELSSTISYCVVVRFVANRLRALISPRCLSVSYLTCDRQQSDATCCMLHVPRIDVVRGMYGVCVWSRMACVFLDLIFIIAGLLSSDGVPCTPFLCWCRDGKQSGPTTLL